MSELTRRKLLGATGAAAATGLAGCLDSFVDNDSDGGTGNDGGGDDDGSVEPRVVNYSTTTTNTGCASDDTGTVSVEKTDNGVRVTGAMEASTPCHEAVVDSATIDGEDLAIAMVTEDNSGDEICEQCLGKIEYETTVDLEGRDALTQATVTHDGGDEITASLNGSGSASASTSGTDDSEATIQSAQITTLDASCGNDEEDVEVSKGDGSITVDGYLSAPDPCREANLDATTFSDGELSVSVRSKSTLGEDEMCQQCLGRIEYEATVDVVDTARVTTVTVDHESGDSFTASWNSASAGDE